MSLLLVGSLAESLGWLSRSLCMGSSGLLLHGISPSGLTSRVHYPSHGSSELPTVESSSGQAFLRLKPGTVTASLLLPSIDESQSQAQPRFRKRGLQEGMGPQGADCQNQYHGKTAIVSKGDKLLVTLGS